MGSMADSSTGAGAEALVTGVATEVPVSPSVPEQEESVAHGESVEHGAPNETASRCSFGGTDFQAVGRTREGFDLTAGALSKVQEHLDLPKQNGRDLSQLAQEVHAEKIGTKYQLAQIQSVLSSFQQLEWQLCGTKSEANTSLKSISNKILGAQTACKEGLKTLHGEVKDGNDKIVQAINEGFNKLATAMLANPPPVKEASAPAYPPVPPPTMPPGTPPAGSSVTSTMPTPNVPMVNTPQMPARVPPTSMGSMASIPAAPAVATAARNEPQPPMVLLVADESGAQRIFPRAI